MAVDNFRVVANADHRRPSRAHPWTDDDVEFATDMEDPVCEGSEEHSHRQEQYPHRITDVYFGFKIFTKEITVGWIIVLNSF